MWPYYLKPSNIVYISLGASGPQRLGPLFVLFYYNIVHEGLSVISLMGVTGPAQLVFMTNINTIQIQI